MSTVLQSVVVPINLMVLRLESIVVHYLCARTIALPKSTTLVLGILDTASAGMCLVGSWSVSRKGGLRASPPQGVEEASNYLKLV